MSRLDLAMEKHMEYIVKELERPFCVRDFVHFEYDGTDYYVASGTFRNKMCQLRYAKKVIPQYRTTHAYYSLPGYEFGNHNSITQDHAGLPIKIGKQTEFYKWLVGRPLSKQALHNIRITFKAENIWNSFSKILPDQIDKANKDIRLKAWKFFDEIDVNITIHHTDTVSIAIACSLRPLAIDIPDLFYIIEILTRIEVRLTSYYESHDNSAIPRYNLWIAKMWHFGIDSIDRYDREAFHVTVEEGLSDVYRIYTKKMKGGNLRLRMERQEYPDKPILEALLEKIYLNGTINSAN